MIFDRIKFIFKVLSIAIFTPEHFNYLDSIELEYLECLKENEKNIKEHISCLHEMKSMLSERGKEIQLIGNFVDSLDYEQYFLIKNEIENLVLHYERVSKNSKSPS